MRKIIIISLAQVLWLMSQAVFACDAKAFDVPVRLLRDTITRATCADTAVAASVAVPDSTVIPAVDTLRAAPGTLGAAVDTPPSCCAAPDTLCSQADSIILPKYTVALKTNLLYDVLSAVNFSVEFPIGDRFSIEVQDIFPWWNWGPHGNKYAMQYLSVGPEFRWWFSRTDDRKYLTGHWVGLYAHAGKYDLQRDKDICRQNKFFSTGLSYGYSMPICSWLNMEFTVSVGYARMKFQHYQPSDDYENLYKDKYNSGKMDYFGPTKLGVTLTLPIDFYRRSDREARRAQHRSCLSATEQIPQLADTEE